MCSTLAGAPFGVGRNLTEASSSRVGLRELPTDSEAELALVGEDGGKTDVVELDSGLPRFSGESFLLRGGG